MAAQQNSTAVMQSLLNFPEVFLQSNRGFDVSPITVQTVTSEGFLSFQVLSLTSTVLVNYHFFIVLDNCIDDYFSEC